MYFQGTAIGDDLFLKVKVAHEVWAVVLGFALRRMMASFGATYQSRFQTSSSPRPNHHSKLRKIPKECGSHLHRSGSLKLPKGNT
jgi:hypothetical protein